MRPTVAQLNRMTNTELKYLAEQNPNNRELLLVIHRALFSRTNANAEAARQAVELRLGILPPRVITEVAAPQSAPRQRHPYLLRLAIAAASLVAVGIGNAAGQSIWTAVETVIAGR
jgi:hypothetical protein